MPDINGRSIGSTVVPITLSDGTAISNANPLPIGLEQSATATHTRLAVTTALDVVILANAAASFRSVQVIGDTGSILIAFAATTSGATVGDVLNAAPESGIGGGVWESSQYTGPIALRAVGGNVSVSVVEL